MAHVRNKRGDKAKQVEMTKNLEERTKLLGNIVRICESLPRDAATTSVACGERMDRQTDAEAQIFTHNKEKMERLKASWGRHGNLLCQTTEGSEIDTNLFFDALVPSLTKGVPEVVQLAVDNFELVLDLGGENLIPLVRSLELKIKHYVNMQAQFYTMLAMLVQRFGLYLNIDKELVNYVEDFEKEKTVEALDLFAAILSTYRTRLSKESLISLLSALSNNSYLNNDKRFIRCLNEFFPARFPGLSLEKAVEDLLGHTKGLVFADPEYNDELGRCRLLSKTLVTGF